MSAVPEALMTVLRMCHFIQAASMAADKASTVYLRCCTFGHKELKQVGSK